MSEWGFHFVECLRPFSRSLLAIAGLVLVKVGLAHDLPWPRIDPLLEPFYLMVSPLYVFAGQWSINPDFTSRGVRLPLL